MRLFRPLLALALLAAPQAARAQGLVVRAVSERYDNDLLQHLTGIGAGVSLTRYLAVSGERVSTTLTRTGGTCTEIVIGITDCSPEAIRGTARATTGSIEVRIPVWQRAALGVDALVAPRITRLSSTSEGLRSGRRNDAHETVVGATLGVGIGWQPSPRVPLRVQGTAGIGALGYLPLSECADCSTPLRKTFGFQRYTVGVAYAWGKAR